MSRIQLNYIKRLLKKTTKQFSFLDDDLRYSYYIYLYLSTLALNGYSGMGLKLLFRTLK